MQENYAGDVRHRRLPLRKLAMYDPRSMFERFRFPASSRRLLDEAENRYLHSVGAYNVLPKMTSDVLITKYVSDMDRCLPIIDGNSFLRAYFVGKVSNFLVQAICLVACKLDDAVPYLRLAEKGPLLDPGIFARRLFKALDAAMKSDLEPDRLVRLQILALMSLHHEGNRGIEKASLCLCQAIHDCHTLSLHYLEPGRQADDEASLLWWCLRVS